MQNSPNLSRLPRQSDSGIPIYRRIYERIRGGILSGELAAGARLPSARSLASQLSVARGTVETAYQLLAGEGYIAGRGASGTFVEPAIARVPTSAPPAASPAATSVQWPGIARSETPLLFRMGVPALDAFPRKLWSRLLAKCARSAAADDFVYQDPAGQEALRRTIAGYLLVARGVACTPEQIFITTGYQGALALIGRTLLKPGDKVWVEDPGYFLARQALQLAGANLAAVPVDQDGIDVEFGRDREPEARLALVTPTHQFPLGATLPISRRVALLDWASDVGAWIIEDDYDSEFRYRGRPLPALKSVDARERVLHAGTFSKVLFPALRMGYLVVPRALADRFQAACAALQPAPPALLQAVVAAFIAEGHFGRHIKRMRQLYADRRAALVEALRETCSGTLTIEAPAGGMHLICRLPPGTNDLDVIEKARERKMWPAPLSASAMRRPLGSGLLLGFTNVPVAGAAAAAAALRALLEG